MVSGTLLSLNRYFVNEMNGKKISRLLESFMFFIMKDLGKYLISICSILLVNSIHGLKIHMMPRTSPGSMPGALSVGYRGWYQARGPKEWISAGLTLTPGQGPQDFKVPGLQRHWVIQVCLSFPFISL